MSLSDAARADLYTGLTEVLGRDRAETLMAYLPTFDPIDIVTKGDLAEFRADLERRFAGVEQRFDVVDERFELLNGRIDLVDQRLDDMARQFEGIDRRFEGFDGRFQGFDRRFEGIDGHLLALGKRIDRLYYILVTGVFAIIAAMVGLALFDI